MSLIRTVVESLVKNPKHVYYHGSNTELPIGTILMPRTNSRVDTEAETILEENRPEHYVSRNNVVFMAATPSETHESGGTSYEYVYEVKPLGPVSKHALYFLHEVDDPNYPPNNDYSDETLDKYRNDCAYKYWTEKPVPNEMVEYTTTSARIIRKAQ